MKTAIITTTINVPVLLEDYVKNVKRFKHDCLFVIIGDKKTPAKTKTYCNNLKKKYQAAIYYLDVPAQVRYLKKFPELGKHLLYNSIQRRNIALVKAYELGAEKIITIDDDNFFIAKDFISLHDVDVKKEMEILSSDTKWLNACDFLQEKYRRRIYHRGFPQEYRFLKEKITKRRQKINIVVNAGFWLGDPDIDALTRLYFPNWDITATKYLKKNNFTLAKGTWSPFNSQNTALARKVIPAYFVSPYVGRYDDIWGSYVVKKIADHLDDYIAFGHPLVKQERNPHNYWKDLKKEDMGMILTNRFSKTLRKIKLTKKTYQACYAELTKKLTNELKRQDFLPEEKKYLDKYLEGMNVWIKTFKHLK